MGIDRNAFWRLIDASRGDRSAATYESLVSALSTRPLDAIYLFHRLWYESLHSAYTWDLWGAFDLINCGASDDAFEYDRYWLILQGRDVFERAVANPDALVDVVAHGEDIGYECYPGPDAWRAATGQTDDYDSFYTVEEKALERLGFAPVRRFPGVGVEPSGERWDFKNEGEARRRLPLLTDRFFGKRPEWLAAEPGGEP